MHTIHKLLIMLLYSFTSGICINCIYLQVACVLVYKHGLKITKLKKKKYWRKKKVSVVCWEFSTHLVSFTEPKGYSPGILHRLTHQGITTGKDQSFLYRWRIIPNNIDYQLHVLWLTNLSKKVVFSLFQLQYNTFQHVTWIFMALFSILAH